MAGNILQGYAATTVTVTTTNLVSASAASVSLTAGWTSNTVTNNVNNYVDYAYSGQFTTTSANRQVGYINVWVIASLNDTPTWTATSAGTLGTESATQVKFENTASSTNQLMSIGRLLASIYTTATNGEIYTFPQTGIAQLFGGVVPTHHCLFISNSAASTTSAGFANTCALYYQPIIGKYT